MKKSEQYHVAMRAVLAFEALNEEETLEILETLMSDKSGALYREQLDAERAAKEAAQA